MARKVVYKTKFATGLPTSIAASLGRMIARYSQLELDLSLTLYALAGVEGKIGRVVIGNPRPVNMLSRMQELAEVLGLDLSPFPWSTFKGELQELKTGRDKFAHSVWAYDSSLKQYLVFVTSGKWSQGSGPPSRSRKIYPEGMITTAADLKALRTDIEKGIKQAAVLNRFVTIALAVRRYPAAKGA